MGIYKKLVINLISINANTSGVFILIDFLRMSNRITENDKIELLTLLNVQGYDTLELIEKIPTIYSSSEYLDPFWVKIILKEYVLANVITQEKANEIKTACGIS